MSTRCNIRIKDKYETIQLYRHSDGYPDGPSGVIAGLKEAYIYSWQLPRFEACDFAAAIVRAWKKEGGGGIYIDATPVTHGDIAYLYEITQDVNDGLFITVHYRGKLEWAGPLLNEDGWHEYPKQ